MTVNLRWIARPGQAARLLTTAGTIDMKNAGKLVIFSAALACTGASDASLLDRGGGMIYDTVLNITILQDWNSANTSGLASGTGGGMDWLTATAWASNLVCGGYSDWRLPSALNLDGSGPCSNFYCNRSEMGQIWYVELGNDALSYTNAGPFLNLQSGNYWSNTADPSDASKIWTFDASSGAQNQTYGWFYPRFAVAVRDGDVSAVPEPVSIATFVAGLGILSIFARKRWAQVGE